MQNGRVILADCSIEYVGRGHSNLAKGTYLVIIKPDGSIQIHSRNLLKPKNYMGSGSRIEIADGYISAKNKSERIDIIVDKILIDHEIMDWSDNSVYMNKTESQLVRSFTEELKSLYPTDKIYNEYPTDGCGLIDILRDEGSDLWHIYEVKRNVASISSISQTLRYLSYASSIGKKAKGYIISPRITANAEALAIKNGIEFIFRDFSMVYDGKPIT